MNEPKNTRIIAKLPDHVRSRAEECDAYFKRVIAAAEKALGETMKDPLPIGHRFFISRSEPSSGYHGNNTIQTEVWRLYWVACINRFDDYDMANPYNQWSFITSSFWHGRATNAIIMDAELEFNDDRKVHHRGFCGWHVCPSVPSETKKVSSERIAFTTNGHLMELDDNTFASMMVYCQAVIYENLDRARFRKRFQEMVVEEKRTA